MSTYPLPYPLPQGYDPNGPYKNPGQTMPFPSPSDAPVGLWNGNRQQLTNWAANPSAGVLWQFVWASPIFDMRPDLRSMSENRTNKTFSGIPIWRSAGQNVGAKLILQLHGLTDLRGFKAIAQDEGHVFDVAQVTSISAEEDVTAQFTNKGTDAVVIFDPFGGSYPIRYWRQRIVFQVLDGFGFPVVPAPGVDEPYILTTQAAVY